MVATVGGEGAAYADETGFNAVEGLKEKNNGRSEENRSRVLHYYC